MRALVLMRDDYSCIYCGNDAQRAGGEVHHRCPRRMGGSLHPLINSPANLVLLCSHCHRYTEQYREHGRATGYLLSKPEDAPLRPVFRARGGSMGWWVLTEEGTRFRLTPDEVHAYINEDRIDPDIRL